MTDHEKLREAICGVRGWLTRHMSSDELRLICDAAESTLPKTKMVDRWHMEYAYRYSKDDNWKDVIHSFGTREAANEGTPKNDGRTEYACIRVTGPHQQEVPA